MTAGPRQRRLVLACALVASLAASAWTWQRNRSAAEVAEALPVVERVAVSGAPLAAAAAAAPAARRAPAAARAAPAADLFAPVNWDAPPPPPPPPPPAAAPAAPQAPPLPFEYFGRTEVVGEAGAVLIHLRRGREVFSVREGGAIDEEYRLDKVGAEALEIAYLPLSAKQTLVIGPR